MNRTGRSGARRAAALAAATLAWSAGAVAGARAQDPTPWRYDQDVNVSYEYDDNVREEIADPVRAQVGRVAYRGDLQWAGGSQRLSLAYQGGFKRHFGLVNDSVDVSSQLVNDASATYLRRLTDAFALSARLGLKDRTWTNDKFFFINEDGFRRYSGGINALVNLAPDEPGGGSRFETGVRASNEEFRNLDQFFGNEIVGGFAAVTREYGPNVEASATYSFDRIRFPGRGRLTPADDNPANITGTDRPRQVDQVHELAAEVEWFGALGVVAEYRFRYNDSNSYGFTYYSHNVGLQLLRELPWGMFAQAYGRLELRSRLEPVPALDAGSLNTGDTDNNVLLLRLVKDVTDDYAIEARYARYRNESITLNDYYSKNIYAVGVTYRP